MQTISISMYNVDLQNNIYTPKVFWTTKWKKNLKVILNINSETQYMDPNLTSQHFYYLASKKKLMFYLYKGYCTTGLLSVGSQSSGGSRVVCNGVIRRVKN